MRRGWSLVAIVAVAILVRTIYFCQLEGSPCFRQYEWAQTDMHYFDAWGRAIASGDLLSTSVGAPMHRWHVALAAQHLAAHPEALPELQKRLGTEKTSPYDEPRLAELVWDRWLGGKTFYQDPLYPYLIGVTYALLGPDPRWVYVWQMLLGVATTVLVVLVSRRAFGNAVGNAAGLLTTLCTPLLCYELVLVRETLLVFLSFALLLLTQRAIERPSTRRWLCTGVVLGLGILAKSTFVLLAILFAVALVLDRKNGSDVRLRAGLAMAGGVLAVLSLLIARNVVVGVAPFGLASSGAITFVSHNTADYDASLGGFAVSAHAARIMGDSDGRFLSAIEATLQTHSVGSYLGQLWSKFATMWHWFEQPDNSNFYLYRRYAGVLYIPVTFAIIGPLAVVGLVLHLLERRRRVDAPPAWPLHALLVTSMVSLLAFMVMSRVRIPFVAALIPFAAFGLVRVIRWRPRRGDKAGAMALGILVLAGATIGRPLSSGATLFRGFDFVVASQLTHGPRIREALDHDDFPACEREFDSALREAQAAATAAGAANVQGSAYGVDGILATYLFDSCYEPLVVAAARSGHWRRAADVLGSFLKRPPESLVTFGRPVPDDPMARRTSADTAAFYAGVYRDCAAFDEQTGNHSTAASKREMAQRLDDAIRSPR